MAMTAEGTFAAVDLGASSGRVMVARVGPERLDLHEVHRFPNRPVRTAGTLHWDVLGLYGGILDGLRAAGRDPHVKAVLLHVERLRVTGLLQPERQHGHPVRGVVARVLRLLTHRDPAGLAHATAGTG